MTHRNITQAVRRNEEKKTKTDYMYRADPENLDPGPKRDPTRRALVGS